MSHKNNIRRAAQPERPAVLTIAGSDSGGGAGIQADLKTFMALGAHGLCAIAALTAQNTRGVTAIHRPSSAFLRQQINAVFDDFPVAAVKIGMLGSVALVETVAEALIAHTATHIVLDPVMVATSGARLSERRAVSALNTLLLPMADVLTPNLPEAEVLTGMRIADTQAQKDAALRLLERVRGGVLLKGGHLPAGDLTDLYAERDAPVSLWRHPRRPIQAHGTGCTLASAIAAYLAHGIACREAVGRGIAFLQEALARAYRPGRGDVFVPDPAATFFQRPR